MHTHYTNRTRVPYPSLYLINLKENECVLYHDSKVSYHLTLLYLSRLFLRDIKCSGIFLLKMKGKAVEINVSMKRVVKCG